MSPSGHLGRSKRLDDRVVSKRPLYLLYLELRYRDGVHTVHSSTSSKGKKGHVQTTKALRR
jgi:hypothetical protein